MSHHGAMRVSQFWELMSGEFGASYARSVAADHALAALGHRTASEALADGIAPRLVWRALCDDLQIPPERRFGVDRPGRDAPEE